LSPAKLVTIRQLVRSGISDRTLAAWVKAARRRLPRHGGTVSVVIVGPVKSRQLNQRYRRKDRPTNVLTFTLAQTPSDEDWGEIFLCPSIIRQEARQQGKAYRAYFKFLLQHGLIHLLGLDHHTSADHRRWQRYERRLNDLPS